MATQSKKTEVTKKPKKELVKLSNQYKSPKKPGKFLQWVLKKFGKVDDAPSCAQETIPYKEMYKDGICKATDKLYNKTISFEDKIPVCTSVLVLV